MIVVLVSYDFPLVSNVKDQALLGVEFRGPVNLPLLYIDQVLMEFNVMRSTSDVCVQSTIFRNCRTIDPSDTASVRSFMNKKEQRAKDSPLGVLD
jgi:hypothetical protein